MHYCTLNHDLQNNAHDFALKYKMNTQLMRFQLPKVIHRSFCHTKLRTSNENVYFFYNVSSTIQQRYSYDLIIQTKSNSNNVTALVVCCQCYCVIDYAILSMPYISNYRTYYTASTLHLNTR